MGQAGLAKNFHVFAQGELTYAKFACDQVATYTIVHQIPGNLPWEMFRGVLQPPENLLPAVVRESSDGNAWYHCFHYQPAIA